MFQIASSIPLSDLQDSFFKLIEETIYSEEKTDKSLEALLFIMHVSTFASILLGNIRHDNSLQIELWSTFEKARKH